LDVGFGGTATTGGRPAGQVGVAPPRPPVPVPVPMRVPRPLKLGVRATATKDGRRGRGRGVAPLGWMMAPMRGGTGGGGDVGGPRGLIAWLLGGTCGHIVYNMGETGAGVG